VQSVWFGLEVAARWTSSCQPTRLDQENHSYEFRDAIKGWVPWRDASDGKRF